MGTRGGGTRATFDRFPNVPSGFITPVDISSVICRWLRADTFCWVFGGMVLEFTVDLHDRRKGFETWLNYFIFSLVSKMYKYTCITTKEEDTLSSCYLPKGLVAYQQKKRRPSVRVLVSSKKKLTCFCSNTQGAYKLSARIQKNMRTSWDQLFVQWKLELAPNWCTCWFILFLRVFFLPYWNALILFR